MPRAPSLKSPPYKPKQGHVPSIQVLAIAKALARMLAREDDARERGGDDA